MKAVSQSIHTNSRMIMIGKCICQHIGRYQRVVLLFGDFLDKSKEGETDDIVVVAANRLDKQGSERLDTVPSCLVHRLAGPDVPPNRLWGVGVVVISVELLSKCIFRYLI